MERDKQLLRSERNLQEALRIYYKLLYPYNLICEWLSYGSAQYLSNREVALILPKGKYLRYQSFITDTKFRTCLLKNNPIKIDLGAVYDRSPCDRLFFTNFKAIQKELVFDIDLTDYDAIRTCCKDANVCNKCWKFISVTCKIIQTVLKEDFGFTHILWVFSGRRGVHCWVCDKDARVLSDKARACILGYLNIIEGGVLVKRRVNLRNELSYPIKRALGVIDDYFVDFIIKEQDFLGSEEGLQSFLDLLWDGPQGDFEVKMRECDASLDRWNAFVFHFDSLKINNLLPDEWRYLKDEIVLHFLYPRLDLAVTRKMDHLLKGPFCVHPKTGKVCVPFDPEDVEGFNVDEVPTICMVLDELNRRGSNEEINCDTLKNLLCTSLSRSVKIFINFVNTLEKCDDNIRI